ncbi:MAG: enoyl-CoA hydratase-related protein [Actinomycetota bacterium]|nr:enoyl-CoA hydratase-related protein [Actinomycetota bacterium]
MTQPVQLDTADGVATITLARPDQMNSLTLETKSALLHAVRAVADDRDVRAVVLTGSGRAFSVGQDLREHADLLSRGPHAALDTVAEHYNPLTLALATMPKPVVAAVNGTAAGAGLGLACVCDVRIAAAGSRWTTAFTGIGLSSDCGLSYTLPRLVGLGRATTLLLLAEPFTAEQALEMGLAAAVVPPDQVLPAATELARRLAVGPTTAYAAVKQALRSAASGTLEQALEEEDRLQTLAGATADHTAAVRSFLAKERPIFTGR